MRILSIGNFYNPSWDSSVPDEEHIAGAMEELGHTVIRRQREENGGEGYTQIDFILVAQWDNHNLEQIKMFQRMSGCPIVYWAFDYQADGQEWHEHLVKESDLYLSKRIADSKYPNWQWLSQDFSPSFLDKAPPTNKDIDVLFTGSYLGWAEERNATLKAVDERFNLVIHSVNEWPGFKDVRPPIMDEGLPELYARAKVILSIDHTIEAGYWSDRNAQIMACGRRPLFRYVPLSEARFGDSVDYFYSAEDCLDKIANYTTTSYLGIDMDNVSYLYAHENLLVRHRVQDLLTIVRQYV